MGVHDPDDVLPVMLNTFFFEHVPDGVDELVGKHSKVYMSLYPLIILMMDWSYVQQHFEEISDGEVKFERVSSYEKLMEVVQLRRLNSGFMNPRGSKTITLIGFFQYPSKVILYIDSGLSITHLVL